MTALEDWRQLAQRENRRARDVWNAGVARNEDTPATNPHKILRDRHALAEHCRPHFEAGLTPEQIAVREQMPEAAVWQALATHMRKKHSLTTFALPIEFYRMRLERVMALRAAGMKRREVVAKLGISEWILDADLKRLRAAGIDPGTVRARPTKQFPGTGRDGNAAG